MSTRRTGWTQSLLLGAGPLRPSPGWREPDGRGEADQVVGAGGVGNAALHVLEPFFVGFVVGHEAHLAAGAADVADVAEAAGLLAVAVDGDRLALDRVTDKSGG